MTDKFQNTIKEESKVVIKQIKDSNDVVHDLSAKYWDGYAWGAFGAPKSTVNTYVINTKNAPFKTPVSTDGVSSIVASSQFVSEVADAEGLTNTDELWSTVHVGDIILNKQPGLPDWWVVQVDESQAIIQLLEPNTKHYHILDDDVIRKTNIITVSADNSNSNNDEYATWDENNKTNVYTGLDTRVSTTNDWFDNGLIVDIAHNNDMSISVEITDSEDASPIGGHTHNFASTIAYGTEKFIETLASGSLSYAVISGTQDVVVTLPSLVKEDIHNHTENSVTIASAETKDESFEGLIGTLAFASSSTSIAGAATSVSNIKNVIETLKVDNNNTKDTSVADSIGGTKSTQTGDATNYTTSENGSHTHTFNGDAAKFAEHTHDIDIVMTEDTTARANAAAAVDVKDQVVGTYVDNNGILSFPRYTKKLSALGKSDGYTTLSGASTITLDEGGSHGHTYTHKHSIGDHVHLYASTVIAENATSTFYQHRHGTDVSVVSGYNVSKAYSFNKQQETAIRLSTSLLHTHENKYASSAAGGVDSAVTGYGTSALTYAAVPAAIKNTINSLSALKPIDIVTGYNSDGVQSAITSLDVSTSCDETTDDSTIGVDIKDTTVALPTLSVTYRTIEYKDVTGVSQVTTGVSTVVTDISVEGKTLISVKNKRLKENE